MLSPYSLRLRSCHLCFSLQFTLYLLFPHSNCFLSLSIHSRVLLLQEYYLVDKTIHQKVHLIFCNCSNRQQVFVQTHTFPSTSTHVVLLQLEALITIKRSLISKHMGRIHTLQLLPLRRHQLLVILRLGGVETNVLPSLLSINLLQHQKNAKKIASIFL